MCLFCQHNRCHHWRDQKGFTIWKSVKVNNLSYISPVYQIWKRSQDVCCRELMWRTPDKTKWWQMHVWYQNSVITKSWLQQTYNLEGPQLSERQLLQSLWKRNVRSVPGSQLSWIKCIMWLKDYYLQNSLSEWAESYRRMRAVDACYLVCQVEHHHNIHITAFNFDDVISSEVSHNTEFTQIKQYEKHTVVRLFTQLIGRQS